MDNQRVVYLGLGINVLAIPAYHFLPQYEASIAFLLFFIGAVFLVLVFIPIGWSWRAFLYGFTPLEAAAKKVYEINRDKTPARFAEHAYGDKADPLGWFAQALIGSKIDSTGVHIYGCKPHLDILSEIPRREYFCNKLIVDKDRAFLQEKYGTNAVIYDRLHIKRGEMKARIKEILTWDIPDNHE
jgi:hypothetical protein